MMPLAEAASALSARSAGGNPLFTGVSTDTRTIGDGELFVALRGERFDGHRFLGQAREKGAVAAMVDERYDAEFPMPVVVVPDTKLGLGRLAAHWRARFSPMLIAVAGSNGKTTVKEMLASILRAHAGDARVLQTQGNLNNEIGLPLTLLRMRAGHQWCAIELGMNHKGEIAYLAELTRPAVAVVNNAQREHLEFMNSVEEVAAENASVYDALPPNGVAVLNADDAQAPFFRKAAGGRRVVEFGLSPAATVTGAYDLRTLDTDVEIRTATGRARATLAIPGLHNVRNALAAAACAYAADIPLERIAAGLSAFRPYVGRLQVKRSSSGATVIDDSYNANPDSVRAAIDVLASCEAPTTLVLGDMGEVGSQGPQFHREVGAYALAKGITAICALGEATRDTVAAFGAGARHFDSVEELIPQVHGRTILVKGSRFMRMERVVAALTAQPAGGH